MLEDHFPLRVHKLNSVQGEAGVSETQIAAACRSGGRRGQLGSRALNASGKGVPRGHTPPRVCVMASVASSTDSMAEGRKCGWSLLVHF